MKKQPTTPSATPATPSSIPPRLRRKSPAPLALEQRLIFDADVAKSADTIAPAEAPVDRVADSADKSVADQDHANIDPGAQTTTAEAAASGTREIVFIDTAVTDWEVLASNVKPDARVILLDPATDALRQIQQALSGYADLDAIHIVSHGGEGELILGDKAYHLDNLDRYADRFAEIGGALAEHGDILLYGCDVGAGAAGMAFIGRLADLTSADIAASDDNTGSARHGADWTLEAADGTVEADRFITEQGVADYQHWFNTVALDGKSGWTAVMFGTAQDPQGDSQAKAADTDIVADLAHGSFYIAYDDRGTGDTNDDFLAFRLRVDNPSSEITFGGVGVVGIDANNDGRIDLFIMVDGRNNGQVIRLMDPGTARLSGDRVPFVYWVLRRPLAAAREFTGL